MIPAKELKRALEVAWKIPGLYGRQEAAFLYRLARRKGDIVELGCWMGRTTVIILQAASVWGATLTTIDAFTPMPHQIKPATANRWRANLKKVGLTPPKLLAMTTDEAATVYPPEQKLGLLFIDADHSREAVARDLANWTPRVKLGGFVALHDMFYPSIPGVCQAVIDWWCADRASWKYVGQRDYTVAFRRVQ